MSKIALKIINAEEIEQLLFLLYISKKSHFKLTSIKLDVGHLTNQLSNRILLTDSLVKKERGVNGQYEYNEKIFVCFPYAILLYSKEHRQIQHNPGHQKQIPCWYTFVHVHRT